MDDQANERAAGVDRGLLVRGIALMSAGGVLLTLGALVTGAVAVRATRQWVSLWEQPPRVVARQRLAQARSAVVAGSRGWRENGGSTPAFVADDS